MYPEGKSAGRWLYHGWHVTVAYVVGFSILLVVLGWQPHPPHKGAGRAAAANVERTAGSPSAAFHHAEERRTRLATIPARA